MKNILTILFLSLFTNQLIAQFAYFADLAQSRSSFEAVSRNGKVYFIGGQTTGPTRLPYMDVYDESINTWYTVTQDQPIFWPTIVAGDSGIYVIGGVSSSGIITKAVVYKDDESWHDITDIEDQIFIGQAVKVGSKIIVGSGVTNSTVQSGRPHLNKIYIYDELTGNWTTDTLSQKRFMYSIVTDGDSLVLFAGGFMGDFSDSTSDRVDILNLNSNQWTTTTLPSARGHMAGAYLNGRFFFAGGFYRNINGNWAQSDALDIYDGSSWSSNSTLIAARGFMGTAVLHDEIVFYGGGAGYNGIDASSFSAHIDIWDDNAGDWKSQSTGNTPRCYFAMAAGEQAIYAAGGYNGSAYDASVEIYSKYLGAEEFSGKAQYKIYPNPATNILKIEGVEQNSPCILMDQLGKVLLNTTLNSEGNVIDVSLYPKGLYFLQINSTMERLMIE